MWTSNRIGVVELAQVLHLNVIHHLCRARILSEAILGAQLIVADAEDALPLVQQRRSHKLRRRWWRGAPVDRSEALRLRLLPDLATTAERRQEGHEAHAMHKFLSRIGGRSGVREHLGDGLSLRDGMTGGLLSLRRRRETFQVKCVVPP